MLTAPSKPTANLLPLENTLTLDKDYWLGAELRPGYLYVYIHSRTVDYHIARQYWSEIGVMLERSHCDRVLVDKDISAQMSVPDAYRMASEVAAEFRGIKIALCDRNATPEPLRFGESVAVNRGLNAHSFTDLEAAAKWLLETHHPKTVSQWPQLSLVTD